MNPQSWLQHVIDKIMLKKIVSLAATRAKLVGEVDDMEYVTGSVPTSSLTVNGNTGVRTYLRAIAGRSADVLFFHTFNAPIE
jgi:hypothetical protein